MARKQRRLTAAECTVCGEPQGDARVMPMIDDALQGLQPVQHTPQERYEHAVFLLGEAGYRVTPRLLAATAVYDVAVGDTIVWRGWSLDGSVWRRGVGVTVVCRSDIIALHKVKTYSH